MNEKEVKVTNTLLYIGDEGAIEGDFIIDGENETLWATQKTMSHLFGVEENNITYHLKNIFKTKELDENSTTQKFRVVQNEGNRKVNRELNFYNLDGIISVGYRVSSKKATQFRIWATKILKEYMVKGYVLDKELLKNGTRFGTDYFNKLIEEIRGIRISERRFNQNFCDIYATSYDYNPKAEITQEFFATVQNKLIYAVSGKTSAELIAERSDSKKPNMGLNSLESSYGKILLSDTVISKNYLNKKELKRLERTVDGFLTLAENRAENFVPTSMEEWKKVLDSYIELNKLPVLSNKGTVSSNEAKKIAKKHYSKYVSIQDKTSQSDFDKMIDEIKRME